MSDADVIVAIYILSKIKMLVIKCNGCTAFVRNVLSIKRPVKRLAFIEHAFGTCSEHKFLYAYRCKQSFLLHLEPAGKKYPVIIRRDIWKIFWSSSGDSGKR